ncbi:hypothetical protein PRZ48_011135 [Zasmidium cellare]|uniref:Uncharacterized protein n=1 Tax=Zasmidium cellare TaxID=395010 RepID=A0ABR0EAK5_ZASCE|nr:hypothetical protein PRZ48_011135 [Zasmidium cellare]
MQYSTILLTALTALSTGVSGLAIPSLFSRDNCPEYQQAKANQSTIFGLQLAGSAKDQDDLDQTCTQLNEGKYAKWKQEGLFINDIKKPVCQGTPNTTTLLPTLAASTTKLFTHLLLTSFPSSQSKSYLCKNLRYTLLDSLLLNSDTVIATLCNTTATPQAPQPFTPLAEDNSTAVGDVHSASAEVFAYTLASGYSTPDALRAACEDAPSKKDAWNKLLLNGTAVEETLCSIKSPLSVDAAKGKIKEAMSKWYGTVLGGVSNAEGWQEEVCGGLSCESMESVGLDGEVVRGVVGC